MPTSAMSALMQHLRNELEALVEQLSRLADAKRMYGNIRPGPGPRPAAGAGPAAPAAGGATAEAPARAQAPGQIGSVTLGGAAEGAAAAVAAAAAAPLASAIAAAEEADVESLLRRADEGSSRMLALLADVPHAVTSHQPLRGAALLAAALSAYLRGGGTSEAALAGLQAAVKLRPLNPTAWNCLAHSYWERGDLFMAGCCLASGLRHCPSVAGHQMMSLLVRQQGVAAGAALLQKNPHTTTTTTTTTTASTTSPRQQQQQQGQGQQQIPQQKNPHTQPQTQAQMQQQHHQQRQGAAPVPSSSSSSSAAPPPPPPASSVSAALTASLAHARRALELDLENGYSWYVLAMAQMADYFRGDHQPPGGGGGGAGGGAGGGGGGGSPEAGPSSAHGGGGGGDGRGGRVRGRGGRGELHRVLAAFAQAERCGCSDLPDLYYNRAALHAFVQDFGAALQDYSRAALLDPGLPAPAQMDSLVVLLGQLAGLVAGRGGVRGEGNWAAVTALLAGDAARASELLPWTHHERLALRTLRDLQPGSNRGVALLCRALVFVSPPLNASGTLYLVCVDTSCCCLVLALTHIHHDAFDMTQLLTITHPELRHVDITWPPPTPPAPPQAPQNPQQQQPHPAAAAAAAAAAASVPASTSVPSRTYRFPLLMVGCDPGCRSAVLVDGVPLHQAPQTPLLRHVMRAA
ncbi:hypothetical protein PLESTB_001179400 [Pleodorina starrii]|uniref:Uncharacterized protein n=1 Tax=Pleodorina starrii TaxID=330485 RepID=A0A9W6BS06_9CHLO|nr:hypothetical protein PLESTB_001179400 [Pleodorina starrii]GLC64902.1 hypothetical protein PLESTF_000219800 [Pleodorina starrii]